TRQKLLERFGLQLKFFGEQLKEVQRQADAALRDPRTDTASAARLSKVVDALAGLTDPAQENATRLRALLDAVESGKPEEIAVRRNAYMAGDRAVQEGIDAAARAIGDGLRADAAAAEGKSRRALLALVLLTAVSSVFGLLATLLVGRALAPVG